MNQFLPLGWRKYIHFRKFELLREFCNSYNAGIFFVIVIVFLQYVLHVRKKKKNDSC
jgi:hypothetical protein